MIKVKNIPIGRVKILRLTYFHTFCGIASYMKNFGLEVLCFMGNWGRNDES